MQPYQMVKDLRTNEERSDVEKVLDGDIDSYICCFIRSWNYEAILFLVNSNTSST